MHRHVTDIWLPPCTCRCSMVSASCTWPVAPDSLSSRGKGLAQSCVGLQWATCTRASGRQGPAGLTCCWQHPRRRAHFFRGSQLVRMPPRLASDSRDGSCSQWLHTHIQAPKLHAPPPHCKRRLAVPVQRRVQTRQRQRGLGAMQGAAQSRRGSQGTPPHGMQGQEQWGAPTTTSGPRGHPCGACGCACRCCRGKAFHGHAALLPTCCSQGSADAHPRSGSGSGGAQAGGPCAGPTSCAWPLEQEEEGAGRHSCEPYPGSRPRPGSRGGP